MTLKTYIIRRVIIIIPTFFLISAVVFALIHLAPGDPAMIMLRGAKNVSPEVKERVRKELGLDQPILVQYLIWVRKLLQGNFGYSFLEKQPVTKMIGVRIGRTLELMLITEILTVALAIVLGVTAAVKQYSLADALSSLGALIGYSLPNFWIALVSLIVFSSWLGWLHPLQVEKGWLDHLGHLILPVGVLALGWTAYLFRLVRSSMLEVLRQDYITTARAKGLKERVVIYKHALRNALLPVVTYIGYSMGFILAGAVVIETVFAWPGLGRFYVQRAVMRDYPSLMGLSMLIGIMVLLANLAADIAYSIADPRIRYD